MSDGKSVTRVSNEQIYSLLSEKFDILEELMKMILVNDILDQEQTERIENGEIDEIKKILMGLGVENFQLFSFCDRFLIIIELDETVKLKDIRELKRNVEANIANRTPVFLFSKINGNRKKVFEKEKISYVIREKEIHIF